MIVQKDGINARKRTRISGHYQGFVTVDGQTTPMTTNNLSLSGLLCHIEGHRIFEADAPAEITLPLTANLRIVVKAKVVRSDEDTTAFDFTGIDPDSYGHLLNIIRFMSKDPDAIDAEQTKPLFANQPFTPDL